MPLRLPILLFLLACLQVQAQSFEDSDMGKRADSSMKKIQAAVNAYSQGKKGKDDPSLASSMNGKAFEGVGQEKFNKKSDVGEFRYRQKPGPGSYKMTRTFFGIKNPWIGAKIYQPTKEADLSTKSGIVNADRKFTDKQAETSGFYQADKVASKQEELRIKTDTFTAMGETPGAMSRMSTAAGKEMTIDQVRDLLNKERKAPVPIKP